jgi:3-oxoacyl-[acyl-carrier protein] reductase
MVRRDGGLVMDLGLKGRKAIVCASSKGLGRACATALAEAGCEVVINGRDKASLEATAGEISKATGAKIQAVAADVGTPEGRAAILAACPSPDILVNNNGGPPPKDFRQLSHDDLVAGVEKNMITPISLIQAVIDGMTARKFGRIINITSGSVKAPLPSLDLSSGARAGLTAFIAGVARQVAKDNVTINCILPGAFLTDRLRAIAAQAAKEQGKSPQDVLAAREKTIPAGRLGDPDEFGRLCAYLASTHAGYITGQNFLIDGGAFPGAF